MNAPIRLYRTLTDLAARLEWTAPLLIRLVFGYFWAETGWAKLHNLDGAIQRFTDWGIPYPAFNATFSAGAEFVLGIAMIIGLAYRFAMAGLIINMIVALVSVVIPNLIHSDDGLTLDGFVELDEVFYSLVLFWMLLAGPGRISLDHLIAKKLHS